jgi:polyadenylate-binding protein
MVVNGATALPASGGAGAAISSTGGTGELPNVSLYVGDLQPDVVEQNLFELFSSIGPVVSVRVCRDVVTRRSLGYAYVNFQAPEDAERALDVLQFYEGPLTKNKPIRIMWKRSDPSVRRNPEGNIFIKNLDKSIDNKALYDTFSTFGKVLSCKLATDEKGNSLGYAFVHYQDPNVAKYVISKMNGMLLNGQKVFVGEFRPRREREATGELAAKFTNVYVKNLDEASCTNEAITKLFEPFGKITSIFIPTETVQERKPSSQSDDRRPSADASDEAVALSNGVDGRPPSDDQPEASTGQTARSEAEAMKTVDGQEEGEIIERVKPRGFAFVNFETPEQAAAAVEALNGTEHNGRQLYVGRAQKKAERESMLRAQQEQARVERMQKLQDVNLFVKNLSDDVDENRLREEFSRFGMITSLRIMRDEKGTSKGFGFVAFSHPDEAIKAVTEMNQRIVGQKPIYVALAQRRDQRRAQLDAQRAAMMRAQMSFLPPGVAASMYMPGSGAPTHPGFPYPYAIHPMQMQMPMGMGRGTLPMSSGAPAYGAMTMQPNMAMGVSGVPRVNMTSPNMAGVVPGGAAGMPLSGPGGTMLMQGRMPYQMVGSQQQMAGAHMAGQGAQNTNAGGPGPGANGPANADARSMSSVSMPGAPNTTTGPMGRAGPRQPRMGGRSGAATGPVPMPGMSGMMGGMPMNMNAPGMGYKMGGAMRAPSGANMAGIVATSSMPGGAGANTASPAAASGLVMGPAASQPLTVQMLANADPKQQKQMLGERLYPLVYQQLVREGKRELAPKITGMLLEMDNSEVLHLVESPEALQEKVEEALEVLQQHLASLQAKAAQQTTAGQGSTSTASSSTRT